MIAQTGKVTHDLNGQRITEYSVAQTAGATPVLLREYIWMDDMLVAVVEQDGSQYGTVYAIRTDHMGRPVFATDATGTKVWEVQYLPFGGVQTVVGAPIDLGFPGQWFQGETGVYQNWMRDYDPTTGSTLQPDPLGLVDGPNVYRYAMANPMRYVDPRGLFNRGLSDLDGTLLDPDPYTDSFDGGPFGDIEVQRLGPDVGGIVGGLARLGLLLMLDGDAPPISTPTPSTEPDTDCDNCPPCSPWPVETIGFTGPEVHSRGKHTQGKLHYHLREVQQRPDTCSCRWQDATRKLVGQHHSPDPIGILNLNGKGRPPSYP